LSIRYFSLNSLQKQQKGGVLSAFDLFSKESKKDYAGVGDEELRWV
jgi:hypothetical protein